MWKKKFFFQLIFCFFDVVDESIFSGLIKTVSISIGSSSAFNDDYDDSWWDGM